MSRFNVVCSAACQECRERAIKLVRGLKIDHVADSGKVNALNLSSLLRNCLSH